ncbi:B-cell receptor CD22-like [Rhopilema esculentum]|uniref:B-cell receptor CD22-like n=1 Tax=Rhopilema esculentum TaxID=499914 RepID=UPI0031CFA1DB|eukprot:gene15470-6719_t
MPTRLSEVPIIEEHPKSGMVELGKDLTLFCKAVGKNLRFTWYKNTKCLIGETSDTLHLRKVNMDAAGRYSCLVSNSKDSLLTWAIVDVVSIVSTKKKH